MGDFQELIKNFEKIREYMRQFYIYGYKVRNEYQEKSLRTYDNEKRRMECFLGTYVREEYSGRGKRVCICVDSNGIKQNPLYQAWKAKSFTDNDIMLHFFLLDLLWEGNALTVSELTDEINRTYEVLFDMQTVRLKLKEYEKEEMLSSRKLGKSVYYQIRKPMEIEKEPEFSLLLNGIKYFQEASPFGFIGSTILDREGLDNNLFRFKHHYIVHTLEDGVLYDILWAMREHRKISFENKSTRSGLISKIEGAPLKIFVSTQTGRRYICLYREEYRRFSNLRLDAISHVKWLEEYPYYKERKQELDRNLKKCWGVSFGGVSRLEEIYVKLYIEEKKEAYVLQRLYKEGRGGEVIQIDTNIYLYSGTFFDTNEILPWIKTFIGRILEVQGSNEFAIHKLYRDLDHMYAMYWEE